MRSFIVEKESKSQSRRKRRQSPEDDGKVRGTVKNLPSYSQLEADVVAINKNFESNGSNVIPLETPEGGKQEVCLIVIQNFYLDTN